MAQAYRYYVRSPDGRAIFGFDRQEPANAVAAEFGEGARLVDTLAQAYQPIAQEIRGGKLVLLPHGGWDTGRFSLDRDLLEAIKRTEVATVHAFLAKGASANARDAAGGTALHWAASKGRPEIVSLLLAHGADPAARDTDGDDPLSVATARGRAEAAALIERALRPSGRPA
ncbi:MAG: ankyrin repeat domain-containing protein [Hyphomicrobiales bacterium]